MNVSIVARIALVCVQAPAFAAAQLVSPRLAIAGVGEWRPSVQIGLEVRSELGDGASYIDTLGVTHRTPPKFLWSAMGLGGVSLGKDGHSESGARPTAQAQAGLLYRQSNVARVGAYVAALAEPQALGVLGRYEPMPAAALQAGWMRRRVQPSDVLMVQVELGLSFLKDLCCGGSR